MRIILNTIIRWIIEPWCAYSDLRKKTPCSKNEILKVSQNLNWLIL